LTDRPTVLVVDDHYLFASSLASVIREVGRYRLVGTAVSGAQALDLVATERPDIVLLDYHLPGYEADTLITRFLASSPATRVVVLTSDTSEGALVSSLRAGAIGFVTKDESIDEVLVALSTVAEGRTILTARQRELAGLPGPDEARSALTPIRVEPLELRLAGVGSFAHAVAAERAVAALPQVAFVYLRDLVADGASLRVGLRSGAAAQTVAEALATVTPRLRVHAVPRGVLDAEAGRP
jgi:DNA-binding NarL/FixJ family response regulator